MKDLSSEIERGEAFAERLFWLVAEHGPAEFSPTERAALGDHLLSTAVNWVQARNRAKAQGPQS